MKELRKRAASEGGYTLVEMFVGLMVGLLVTAASATLVVSMVRASPAVGERAGQVQQGRTLLETITRELRQGETILSSSSSQLSVLTYVRSASCGGAESSGALLCRVDYACTTNSCTRTERSPTGNETGTTTTAVEGIGSPSVFGTSGADPSYVSVTLTFPNASGQEAVTLADGASLRNHFDSVAGA
jgi:Tfp pilus assembly protein PilW